MAVTVGVNRMHYYITMKELMQFYTWTAVPSEKRILSYSSQHGDEGGYTAH